MRRFETRLEPPLSRPQFLGRMLRHGLIAAAIVGGSLFIGMAGYHWLGGMGWVDAYLNAAMILGGMGPVADLRSPTIKLFAGTYALYAGVVFLVVAATVLGPLLHRLMHRFHWTGGDSGGDTGSGD